MNVLLSLIVGLAVSAPVIAGLTDTILGDVDDNGRVDAMDGMLLNLYSLYSRSAPSDTSLVDVNADGRIDSTDVRLIAAGDVNADGQIDSTDVRLIAVYLSDPSNPELPLGIGRSSGEACSVGMELSPGQSCNVDVPIERQADGKRWYCRFKAKADGQGYYNRLEEGPGPNIAKRDLSSPKRIDSDGFQASRIADTSKWKIEAIP